MNHGLTLSDYPFYYSILQGNLPMIETFSFQYGNVVTILGLVGVISTAIILFTAFTRYNNSPLRQ